MEKGERGIKPKCCGMLSAQQQPKTYVAPDEELPPDESESYGLAVQSSDFNPIPNQWNELKSYLHQIWRD